MPLTFFCPAAGTRRVLPAGIPATPVYQGHPTASVAWVGVCIHSQEVVLSAVVSRVFSCWHPLAESQRVHAASIAVQRTVESAVRSAQREEPEGLKEKISLIFCFPPPYMYPSNAAEPTNRYHLREPTTRGLLFPKLGAVLSGRCSQ